jgi:hypothetical protein
MTWSIQGLITSIFTVAAGIAGHITTARGCLQPEEAFPRYYSGFELVRSDITVMRSSGDMSTTGHIMTGDSTALNFEVKDGDRAHRKFWQDKSANAETGQAARVLRIQYQASTASS